MTDRILLRGLRVMAICGALPEEQERAQPFEFDIAVMADLRKAGQTDELADTINYGTLSDDIVAMVTSSRFVLLEHLAQRVADLILADPMASEVTVKVQKLRPPVAQHLESSGVEITRSQTEA